MGFSVNDSSRVSEKPLKFLFYGHTGWIRGLLGKLCESRGIDYVYGSGCLKNRSSLEADLAAVNPTHVFNAAGVTGRPNVNWCKFHKVETILTNVVGTLTLVDLCKNKGLVLINYATGCIFEYDSEHPLGSGVGFKEEDTPNFIESFYSKTKAMVSSGSYRGTPRGHMKEICPLNAKPSLKLESSLSTVLKSVSLEEGATDNVEVKKTDEIASPVITPDDSVTESPATPSVSTGTTLLEAKRRKRNMSRSKKVSESESNYATLDAEKSTSKKRKRKSWTSLKEIAETSECIIAETSQT